MDLESDQSQTASNESANEIVVRFQTAIDRYLMEIEDRPNLDILKAFFGSLVKTIREKVSLSQPFSQSCVLQEADILKIASKHLYYDWRQDFTKAIACLKD